MQRKNVWMGVALLIAVAGFLIKPAHAQRPTVVYGTATCQKWWGTQWWGALDVSGDCIVYMRNDAGRVWSARTDSVGNWWIEKVPSNQWYTFHAVSLGFAAPSSQRIRIYVPERAPSRLNSTQIPHILMTAN